MPVSLSDGLLELVRRVEQVERRLASIDRATGVSLKVVQKATTGDPANGVEGQICINTADNTIHVYGFGGWRQVYP